MVQFRAGVTLTLLAAVNLTACLDPRPVTEGSDSAPVWTGPIEACVVQGGALRLAGGVRDVSGKPYPAESIRWSTSDSLVARVSGGLVTAIQPGTAVIGAHVKDWSGHVSVRVTQGLVSFVIDDGHSSDWSVKRPIFEGRGAVASLAIVSRWAGVRQTSDSELRSLVSQGWEVLAHSRTHAPEDTLTVADLEAQIGGAQQDLAARGLPTTVHVYPYGAHSATTTMVVKEHFDAALTAGGGLNRLPIKDWFAIRRMNLGTAYAQPGQNSLAFYKSLVDSTRVGGHWLIFMIHELTSADSFNLATVLDYTKEWGIPIITVSEALLRVRHVPLDGCKPANSGR